MRTICILYGFCEGPRVSKRFREELEAQGLQVVADPAKADILLGHSGGCFLVPEKTRAKRIIHIGIPHWPGRSIVGSIARKFVLDVTSHHKDGALRFWLRKTLWNVVYFWNMLSNIRMLCGRAAGNLWRYGNITTVIRPGLDTVHIPDTNALPFTGKPKFITIPGHHHDECWRNPQPYIDIIVK